MTALPLKFRWTGDSMEPIGARQGGMRLSGRGFSMSAAISKRRKLPSPEYLRECLRYSPDGRLFWKERPRDHFCSERGFNSWNAVFPATEAGGPQSNGYRLISINGMRYLQHRLTYHAFVAPLNDESEVDHKDKDKSNNRKENLRACTHAQNAMNQGARRKKQPFGKHIHFSKNERKFKVMLRANGRKHNIGTFATLAEAEETARRSRLSLHGQFARSQ